MKNRVKELRQAKGWSQARLADAFGTTQAIISNIESGKQSLTDRQMARLGAIFGVHPGELIDDPAWNKIPFSKLNEPLLKGIGRTLIKLIRHNRALAEETVAEIIASLYRRHNVASYASTPAQLKHIEETANVLIEHELAKRR